MGRGLQHLCQLNDLKCISDIFRRSQLAHGGLPHGTILQHIPARSATPQISCATSPTRIIPSFPLQVRHGRSHLGPSEASHFNGRPAMLRLLPRLRLKQRGAERQDIQEPLTWVRIGMDWWTFLPRTKPKVRNCLHVSRSVSYISFCVSVLQPRNDQRLFEQ